MHTSDGSGLKWKPDWELAREALTAWWNGEGLALSVRAPKDEPWEALADPGQPATPDEKFLDNRKRLSRSQYQQSRRFAGGVAVPLLDCDIGGPGSLGLFLGSVGQPAMDTMWYEAVIEDPESHPPLALDRGCEWWKRHEDILSMAVNESNGRYLVGYPDLMENIDTLAQLRGAQTLLRDLVERPDWVKDRLAEINAAYFGCYEAWWPLLRDAWGGACFGAFELWAPGKVAKVQCDFSCMISPEMFREFVVPFLSEQCEWLDYSMYHLEGTQAVHHLDALLEIDTLDAIEWTPQSGIPGGGSPQWYGMYRRIKAAGKSVRAVNVKPEEVAPLIDGVGAEGLYIMTSAGNEAEARALLRSNGWRGEA